MLLREVAPPRVLPRHPALRIRSKKTCGKTGERSRAWVGFAALQMLCGPLNSGVLVRFAGAFPDIRLIGKTNVVNAASVFTAFEEK